LENSSFLLTCILTISVVFLVLSLLSLSIRLLVIIFPDKSKDDDPAMIAAVNSHYNRLYPHLKVSKIEEQK
jgi:hypothetical protein